MHKFDVKYKFEDYLEYYKYVLIKSKIWRDILFSILFIGIGIYWLVTEQKTTYVAYFCFVFAILVPLWSVISFPLIKRQLRNNLPVIERTHLIVTFNEDEIVYENLSVNAVEKTNENDVKEETKETLVEENQTVSTENIQDDSSSKDEKLATSEEQGEDKETTERENLFKLKYNNFQLVREIANLIVFYLDRQTVVILPKQTLTDGTTIDDFKSFILTKIPAKRVKFSKK